MVPSHVMLRPLSEMLAHEQPAKRWGFLSFVPDRGTLFDGTPAAAVLVNLPGMLDERGGLLTPDDAMALAADLFAWAQVAKARTPAAGVEVRDDLGD